MAAELPDEVTVTPVGLGNQTPDAHFTAATPDCLPSPIHLGRHEGRHPQAVDEEAFNGEQPLRPGALKQLIDRQFGGASTS